LRRALEGILRIAHNEKKCTRKRRRRTATFNNRPGMEFAPAHDQFRILLRREFGFGMGNPGRMGEPVYFGVATFPPDLAWKARRYYWKIQRNLHERFGVVPRYISPTGVYDFYESVQNKEVLFASPLAQLVREQAASGRLQKLYKDFEVPLFSVRTVQAWISTWPNRPHSSWSDTFGRLCEAIEQEYRAKPFEVFVASCGCYGLPLCDFVRNRYGCSVLYIGHFSHVAFGVGCESRWANARTPNPENWVHSDLGRYPNMDRIDRGRYV